MSDVIRRTLQAEVVSKKNQNTLLVKVERKQPHPLYGKVIRLHKQYQVHCSPALLEQVKEGDQIMIGVIRPVSKHKHWEVIEILDANKK